MEETYAKQVLNSECPLCSDTTFQTWRCAARSWRPEKVWGGGGFPATVASREAPSQGRRTRAKPGWPCWRKPPTQSATSAVTSKRSTSYERCGGGPHERRRGMKVFACMCITFSFYILSHMLWNCFKKDTKKLWSSEWDLLSHVTWQKRSRLILTCAPFSVVSVPVYPSLPHSGCSRLEVRGSGAGQDFPVGLPHGVNTGNCLNLHPGSADVPQHTLTNTHIYSPTVQSCFPVCLRLWFIDNIHTVYFYCRIKLLPPYSLVYTCSL